MNNKSSIDGFIPRRPGSELGERRIGGTPSAPRRREIVTDSDLHKAPLGIPREGKEIGDLRVHTHAASRRVTRPAALQRTSQQTRADIDESLRELDDIDQQPRKMSRREKRRWKKEHRTEKQRMRRRITLIITTILGVALLAAGGYLAYKALNAGSKVLKGNLFNLVQNQPLKEDKNGRSNFLVFGTAEDSEGGNHGGANLTDSIMVVSIDQDRKDAYMLSLPRDLWVRYDMPQGKICTVGLQGKLNAQYSCASDDGENEEAGAKALSNKVAEITGLEIQYYVHLNFTAVVEAVDAVGGVDVTIQSDDPRGILDRNFDWRCGYRCYYVNYKNGERVHLDGEHALALARARNAAGGYGLPNGNFDREKNQQMIIKALREKAVSAGTLTNLGAVTGLIDALGNNLRTNIETKEVRTLMDLGMKMQSESIISLSLNSEDNMLVTTGNYNGQSIVRPIAGLMDYSDIIAYVQRQTTSDPFIKEEPHVTVLNGSDVAGVAQRAADYLEEKGFIIDMIDNAPEGKYDRVVIYQVSAEKKATAAKLKELYGVTPKTGTPPVSVTGDTDFVIIIGDDSVVVEQAGR